MNQAIISTELVKQVEKLSRELAAVKNEIKKAVKVPKSQVWFWSKAWQKKEKEADRAIKEGRVHSYSSVDDLIENLHK